APAAAAAAVYLDRDQLSAGHAVTVPASDPNGVAHVSCGQPIPNQWAIIADGDGGEKPDREVGEIWLHGNNIGRGYFGRPDETERIFRNKLQTRPDTASHAEGVPENGSWMATGDLGVYIDGELYLTGRIKDLIVIDGRNHYPTDIETTVSLSSRSVRSGYVAAFSVPGERGEELVIVAERAAGAGRAEPGPIVDAVRAAVSRLHQVRVADVRMVAAGVIPRTTSGKLARNACRSEYLAGHFER
ncbi:AMP-binding protein, partial [Mycobacterium sp. NPDC003449]